MSKLSNNLSQLKLEHFSIIASEVSRGGEAILIFEKNGIDEKSLIFMPRIDIWNEPARPLRSLTAYFSEFS